MSRTGSLFALTIIGTALTSIAAAPQQRESSTETFEVASVRQVQSDGLFMPSRITYLPNGRFQANTTVLELIRYAYTLESFHRTEGQAKVLGDRFEILAQARGAAVGTSPGSAAAMLRALL